MKMRQFRFLQIWACPTAFIHRVNWRIAGKQIALTPARLIERSDIYLLLTVIIVVLQFAEVPA
jgi:hypothetical protein